MRDRCLYFLLPGEISALILAAVLPELEEWSIYDDHIANKYYNQLFELAEVCRRFRDLIYSKASFWTVISNKYDSGLIDGCLLRSRDSRLRIFVEYHEKAGVDGLSFLETVLPFCHRWHSFSIVYYPGSKLPYVQKGFKLMDGIRVGALRSIDWRLLSRTQRASQEFHAYRTWDAPSLLHFSGQDVIPTFEAVSRSQIQLNSCKLHVTRLGKLASHECPVRELASAIASQPNLEELGLEIRAFVPSDEGVDVPSRVTCRSLRTVTIEVLHDVLIERVDSFVQALLQCLELPAIESMTLSVPLIGAPATTFLPSFNSYSNLYHLSLTLYSDEDWSEESDTESDSEESEDEGSDSENDCEDERSTCEDINSECRNEEMHLGEYERDASEHEESDCEGSVHEVIQNSVFTTIFSRAQSLRYLRFYANGAKFEETYLSSLTVTPPPLRLLHLYHTPGISPNALLQVVQFLSRGASWDRFHTLKIEGCPQLKGCHRKLSAYLPREKIVFLD